MAGRTKAFTAALVAASLLIPAPPAFAQMKKGSHGAPPAEKKPKVDEKAYKAALDRIPVPKKPYDPWGQVHDSESAKPAGKP